jgi:hypothetical protein
MEEATVSQAVEYSEQDYHNVEAGGIKVILNWVLCS